MAQATGNDVVYQPGMGHTFAGGSGRLGSGDAAADKPLNTFTGKSGKLGGGGGGKKAAGGGGGKKGGKQMTERERRAAAAEARFAKMQSS